MSSAPNADYERMTGILREEQGMKSAFITDCSVFAGFMDIPTGLLAGQNLWDGTMGAQGNQEVCEEIRRRSDCR